MVARQEVLSHIPTDQWWIGMLAVSVACHVMFLSGVVFLPQLSPTRPNVPHAVEVDLVSLPAGQVRAQPKAEPPGLKEPPRELKSIEPKKKPAPVNAARTEQEDVKSVSLAPKPLTVKKSLKKKTYDVSKAITSAIKGIKKKASESRPSPVLHAIDKLKKKVDTPTGAAGTDYAAGTAGMSKKRLELLDIYNAEIWHGIQKNWAFSEHMARGQTDLAAVIIVKIMRDGEIRDIWFENRSGDSYFDDSVFKAVKKSNPLPPLPEGFLRPYYEVGFRFNLSELKRSP